MNREVTITYRGSTQTFKDSKDALAILIHYADSTDDEEDYFTINAARRALSVDNVFGAMYDFDDHLRSIHKYDAMPIDPHSNKTLLEEHEHFKKEYADLSTEPKDPHTEYLAGLHDMAFYARGALNRFLEENGINREELYT